MIDFSSALLLKKAEFLTRITAIQNIAGGAITPY
jgi:hypothetical protein